MTKLHDPDLPPGEIFEKRSGGAVVRNDGVLLQPAEKNPWYVLATVYGEQEEPFNRNKAARNRRIWNGFVCSKIEPSVRDDLAKTLQLDVKDLAPLNEIETDELVKALSERADATIDDLAEIKLDFSNMLFPKPTAFGGFVFNGDGLSGCIFCRPCGLRERIFRKFLRICWFTL
jgi:hypothetical protein